MKLVDELGIIYEAMEEGVPGVVRILDEYGEVIDYAQLIGNTFYGYLTKYKEIG